ncbi:rhodanese-like domain-containing protein [Streptomyces ovatisporus]|uniref:Rhodanese-like domain-containing protein n=1 Tax=Streptomyces ovatisporus TaxID=1128682 RepID=A0ABV9A7X2_9ACTN
MTRTVREVTVEELEAQRNLGDVQVIDVRSPEEYATGHVPGAVNMPFEDLLAAPAASARAGAHVVCHSGRRSAEAVRALGEAGIPAVSVAGGTAAWIESGRKIEGGTP